MLFGVASIAALLGAPAMTLGHGGAFLVIEPSTFSPGGEASIRGAGFGVAEIVVLVLVGPGGELVLESVEADGEGAFAAVIRMPAMLEAGAYRLEARGADDVETIEVTIAPPVVEGDGDGDGRRDEEEPLLAPISPLPAANQNRAPRPSSSAGQVSGAATRTPDAPLLGALAGVLALVAVAGGVVGLIGARRRRRIRR